MTTRAQVDNDAPWLIRVTADSIEANPAHPAVEGFSAAEVLECAQAARGAFIAWAQAHRPQMVAVVPLAKGG